MGIVSRKTIDDFYSNKQIAIVGASRDKKKYGGGVLKELLRREYDAIPINPHAGTIQEKKSYKRLQDVPGGVKAAIAVVPPEAQEQVVLDAAEAGIKTLWLHEHVMKGVSNPRAIYLCEEKGMDCIVGFCPLMFMPNAGFPHSLHRGIMKLFGALPK
ncbi:CoA-binding protein [bacterium]